MSSDWWSVFLFREYIYKKMFFIYILIIIYWKEANKPENIDLSDGKSNSYIITNILNNLAPVSEYRTGTYARILCSLINNNSQSLDINSLPPSFSTAAFLTTLGGASSLAITNVSFPTATIAAAAVSVTRIIKEFQILGGVWSWQSDLSLPP